MSADGATGGARSQALEGVAVWQLVAREVLDINGHDRPHAGFMRNP